jgi:hypothetical protein
MGFRDARRRGKHPYRVLWQEGAVFVLVATLALALLAGLAWLLGAR